MAGGLLSDADLQWARELAATLVTTAIIVSESDDVTAEPVYEVARRAAFEVRTDDQLGAERWMTVMFYVAAHAAGALAREAKGRDVPTLALWQTISQRPLG